MDVIQNVEAEVSDAMNGVWKTNMIKVDLSMEIKINKVNF